MTRSPAVPARRCAPSSNALPRVRCAIAFLAALAALPASAQMLTQPGADLFGDAHVKQLEVDESHFVRIRDEGQPASNDAIKGCEHSLLFQNGRSLRGHLVELTSEK